MENEFSIESFIERLIAEKDLKIADQEILDQVKKDLGERVEERINAAILENMPKEKLEEFNALLDNSDSVDIQKYCQDNIENLDEVVAEALMSFRESYLHS